MAERTPFYRKVVQGLCEQVYDQNGYCISQSFTPLDAEDVERRIVRQEDQVADGELEDDETIEHPEDIEYILQIEKHCDFEMVQPQPPPE
jgi:hypothetical protein